MSLLDEAMETFCFVEKTRKPDGEGGFDYIWSEGAEFQANARFDSSMQAKIAQAQGVKSLYTITTRKDLILEHLEVIKRISDGKYFRVTSNGEDNKTPNSATLNMRQVSAEEFEIPR